MRALLVAACLLLGGCSHFAEDDWLGEDKALHFASSAALAAAGRWPTTAACAALARHASA